MSNIKIGWAERDISTDKNVPIIGQANLRISKGCADKLSLTALVMEDGDYVIFITVDAVQITSTLYLEIKDKVKEKNPDIDVSKIIVNATHCHTGGPQYNGGTWYAYEDYPVPDDENPRNIPEAINYSSPDEYRLMVSDKASDAVCEAFENRNNARIAYGYATASVANSRRVMLHENGKIHTQMYGDTKSDHFYGFEGMVDNKINLLYTFDTSDRLTGAIINVPCPSQISENDDWLSSDYWNEVRNEIRKKYGNIFILPQCAAGGDCTPCTLYYGAAHRRRLKMMFPDAVHKERQEIAHTISNAFAETLEWCVKDLRNEMPITHTVKDIMLSKRLITEEEKKEYENKLNELKKKPYMTGNSDPLAQWEYNTTLQGKMVQCRMILERYREDKESDKFTTELHTVKMGNEISFSTVPFELYTDYMHRIQARSPFTQSFMIQLCGIPQKNGGIYYLATDRAMDNGGYSAYVFSNIISAEGGDELVEEILKELKN